MGRKKLQPWPWTVRFRQYDGHTGRSSRPQIIDSTGKTVSLSSASQATLMAMAPLLLDRLEKLADQAMMMHLQLQSALALNIKKPAALTDAEEAVHVARTFGGR